ncbi:acyl-CoA dehydrogenase family protein [Burkholderia sp. F1]|uniref:acyl-CoA dehydrogenase family protein n=1 Tax=Burkholderia sp. F1 TaxID=3366817 RepID=UPI003D711A13
MQETFETRVREFMSVEIAPYVDAWERDGAYPLALLARAGDAGLLSLGYPADSIPRDPRRLAALIRVLAECGAHGVVVGLFTHTVSLMALAGSAEERVPAMLAGRRSAALALTEPQAGSDLNGIDSVAVRDGSGYRLSGTKTYICNGARADWLIVSARLDGELALFMVECRADGVETAPLDCVGWRSLPLAEVRLRGVRATRIAPERPARALLGEMLKQERLNLAVLATASTDWLLGLTVRHCKSRTVAGKPLFDRSAVRHRLADRHAKATAARLTVQHAVDRHADGALDAVTAAIAKNVAVDALNGMADDALQLHAAQGCIAPSPIERAWRDARLLSIGGGTREILLEITARAL